VHELWSTSSSKTMRPAPELRPLILDIAIPMRTFGRGVLFPSLWPSMAPGMQRGTEGAHGCVAVADRRGLRRPQGHQVAARSAFRLLPTESSAAPIPPSGLACSATRHRVAHLEHHVGRKRLVRVGKSTTQDGVRRNGTGGGSARVSGGHASDTRHARTKATRDKARRLTDAFLTVPHGQLLRGRVLPS
jgi:hypothetical protein